MIIINDESALRINCSDATPNEVGDIILLLEEELEKANKLGRGGIGLAAPQIGIPKKVAIIRHDRINNTKINLVNAELSKGFDPAIFRQEGCLSFPGTNKDTVRYQEVYITNNSVYPNSFIATGIVAVVCQHELDHLNGKLFFDRLAKTNQNLQQNKKIGPNDICLCGSNKKFKKCCGRLA